MPRPEHEHSEGSSPEEERVEETLRDIAEDILDLPALQDETDQVRKRPIREVYPLEEVLAEVTPRSRHNMVPALLEDTGMFDRLAVLATDPNSILTETLGISELNVRASLWNGLQERVEAETRMEAQRAFNVEMPDIVGRRHSLIPSDAPPNTSQSRIRRMTSIQDRLKREPAQQ